MHLPDVFEKLEGVLKAQLVSSSGKFEPWRPKIGDLPLDAPEVVTPNREVDKNNFVCN